MVYVIMGVAGCGKTTVGSKLAGLLGIPYYDGDDYHSFSNKEKMKNGIPLTDEDREPWLTVLAEKIKQWNSQGGAVISCSALRESYRTILTRLAPAQFIYLKGERELILSRLKEREGHFFPHRLMESQFSELEEPHYAITLPITMPPSEICREILKIMGNLSADSPAVPLT
jgi:carbohydrate kinase (thermoresistant glucokinase family)